MGGNGTCTVHGNNFKLAVYFDDRYLSESDETFVQLVSKELLEFVEVASPSVVLLYPPVNNYLRFLIHRTAQDIPELHSFSVGEGQGRRTVVCLKEALNNPSSAKSQADMKGRGRAKFRDNPDRPGGSPAGREGYDSGDNERRDSPVNWQSDTNRWQHDRYTDNKADNSSPGQQDLKQGRGAENNREKYEYGHDTGRWSQDNDCGRIGSPYTDSFGNPDSLGLRTGSPVLDHLKWDDSPRFSALERGRNSPGIVDQAEGNKDGGKGRGRLSAGERGRNSPVIAGQAGGKSAGRGKPERSRNKRPDVQVYVPRARRQQPQEQSEKQCQHQSASITRDQTPNRPTQNKQLYESPVLDMKSSPSLKSHSHEPTTRDSVSSTLTDGHNNSPSLKSHSHEPTTRDSVSSKLNDGHNNSQSQGLSSKSTCQSTELSGKSYSHSQDMPLMTENKTSTIQKKKEMERYVPKAKLQGIAEPEDDLITSDREAKRLKGERNVKETMDNVENYVTSTATSKESTESKSNTVTGDNLFIETMEHLEGFQPCTDKVEEAEEGDIESISDDNCHLIDSQTLGASEEHNTLHKAGEHVENENNINLERERTESHRQFEDMQASFDKDENKNIDDDENILQNENSDAKEMVIDTTTYQESEGMEYTGNDDDIVEANGDAIHEQLVTDEFDNGAELNTVCIEKTEDSQSSFELGAMSEPIQSENKSYTNNSQNDVVVVKERTHEEESAIKDRLDSETRSQDFQSLERMSTNEFNQSADLEEPIINESVNKHKHSKQIEKSALDQCHQTVSESENLESDDPSVQKPRKIKKASKTDKKKTKTVKILKKTKMKPDSKSDKQIKDQEHSNDEGQKPATAGVAVGRVAELACEEDEEEDSWDAKFNDDGECLDPEALEELTRTVGEVQIEKSKTINYLDYQPRDKADFDVSNYNHVIEIYDFPAEFVTRDLITAFQSFMSRGFDLKWVDDTHALGIFSSSIAAQDALDMVHPLLKVCPLSHASKQSKQKARGHVEFLKPYKPRPETTASAARRLVAGALGLATNVSKEKREKERQQLKEAKEKRRQARTNREQIWEFGKCAMDEES